MADDLEQGPDGDDELEDDPGADVEAAVDADADLDGQGVGETGDDLAVDDGDEADEAGDDDLGDDEELDDDDEVEYELDDWPGESRLLLMGDFNAGCSYVSASAWPSISLRQLTNYTWLIPDSMDTTNVRNTSPLRTITPCTDAQTLRLLIASHRTRGQRAVPTIASLPLMSSSLSTSTALPCHSTTALHTASPPHSCSM